MKKKVDTPEAQPRAIPEVENTQINHTIMDRNGTHKYNTRSSTMRVNHVTTFKTAPNMFKMNVAEKITTHIGTNYLDGIDQKIYTITV